LAFIFYALRNYVVKYFDGNFFCFVSAGAHLRAYHIHNSVNCFVTLHYLILLIANLPLKTSYGKIELLGDQFTVYVSCRIPRMGWTGRLALGLGLLLFFNVGLLCSPFLILGIGLMDLERELSTGPADERLVTTHKRTTVL
jgi:hypothetical protein